MSVRAWPYVRGRTKKTKQKKLSNRVPETTTTQAVPSLSRARTCVAVCAKKNKKTFKQPHRPFHRSRKRRLDWGIVFKKIEKEIEKVQKSRKKEYSKSINQEKNRERIQ